jgi:hypothetical protein
VSSFIRTNADEQSLPLLGQTPMNKAGNKKLPNWERTLTGYHKSSSSLKMHDANDAPQWSLV